MVSPLLTKEHTTHTPVTRMWLWLGCGKVLALFWAACFCSVNRWKWVVSLFHAVTFLPVDDPSSCWRVAGCWVDVKTPRKNGSLLSPSSVYYTGVLWHNLWCDTEAFKAGDDLNVDRREQWISFPASLSVNLQFTWFKWSEFTYLVIANERMSDVPHLMLTFAFWLA